MKIEEHATLRLGLDVRMYGRSGIGVYVGQLLARLPKFMPELDLTLFGAMRRKDLPRGARHVRLRAPIYSMKEQYRVPLAVAERGLDLFHAPHYNAPLLLRTPLVVTIHDLIHVLFPEYLPPPQWFSRAYAGVQIRAACARARIILSDSEHTRRDLVRHLAVDPAKIMVTPLGVDESLAPVRSPSKLAAFRRRKRLGDGYVLFVGNLRPHKNLERLVRAFASLCRPGLKLVLVGEEDTRYLGVRDLIRRLGVGRQVVLAGRVPQDELSWYYSASRVLVLPSLYEGFGLSPLEAMVCGIPVVASNAASIPEVTGDAALLVDPLSEREMFRALRAVLDDEVLRRRLVGLGYRRVRLFSWDRTAELTARAYRRATATELHRIGAGGAEAVRA